ncbi:unnamed protein product [Paramecium pentaurelia]|uniref:Uncharacterized protein n=1 Tax=Paramecium pentaurelia TaxID=43138 RepID=A0A8S1SCD2_9CILI|nr:unnamed protein product [Paramecium pentaurelia]
MASITQLDEEYKMYFEQIMAMLDQLTQISLEFVSSKLTFLEKYSQTLKDSQIDARQHRNNQIKHLVDYVKMHRKSKTRSAIHVPASRTFHFHHKSLDIQDTYFEDNVQIMPNSCLNQKSMSDSKSIHTKTIKNILQKMVQKKCSPQKQVNDPVLNLLQNAMTLLETHQQFYQVEFNKLNKDYEEILQENPQFQAKKSLQNKSSKIKQNLNSLIETQKSFKSYLNSIM